MSDADAALFRSRAKLIQSVFDWSAIEVVAEAVSEATEDERRFYVERLGDLYRWSFVHSGGGYPLLRVAARYLDTDYRTLIVGFRTLDNGLAVLFDGQADRTQPDRWAILNFAVRTSPDDVAKRIRKVLGSHPTGAAEEPGSVSDSDRPGEH